MLNEWMLHFSLVNLLLIHQRSSQVSPVLGTSPKFLLSALIFVFLLSNLLRCLHSSAVILYLVTNPVILLFGFCDVAECSGISIVS